MFRIVPTRHLDALYGRAAEAEHAASAAAKRATEVEERLEQARQWAEHAVGEARQERDEAHVCADRLEAALRGAESRIADLEARLAEALTDPVTVYVLLRRGSVYGAYISDRKAKSLVRRVDGFDESCWSRGPVDPDAPWSLVSLRLDTSREVDES